MRASRGNSSQRLREQRKEFHYVLQLGGEDERLLSEFQDVLGQGAARFAEIYYDFLFDNPATAEVLYAYERRGGNIGDLVRAQLNRLLALLRPDAGDPEDDIGARHCLHGVKPVWVIGAYRLYLSHLQKLVAELPDLDLERRQALEATLAKRVFLDMGLMLQGYVDALGEDLAASRDAALGQEAELTRLLDNLPGSLWSVDPLRGSVLHANAAAIRACGRDARGPLPMLAGVAEPDRPGLQAAWERAVAGEAAALELDFRPRGSEAAQRCRLLLRPSLRRRKVVRVDLWLEPVETGEVPEPTASDAAPVMDERSRLYDRLDQAIRACRREADRQAVLMLIELDPFELVDPISGGPADEALRREVTDRLQGSLRESDTLVQLGADRFAVLMPSVEHGRLAAERVAAKLLECCKEPVWLDGEEHYLAGAIGVALFPDHGADADTLFARAERAAERARRSDAGFMIYSPQTELMPMPELQLSGQLRTALERNEFELHYQPKVGMHDGGLVGVEALLRWNHPRDGVMPPSRFLHLAEQSGMMAPITNWVLVTALRQCREWQGQGLSLPVSVNVSARSFQTPRLLERVEWALNEAGVSGESLEIEITEETLMTDLDYGAQVLARLGDLGVRVAVDDFGTGYSSLAYLRRLPIHTLKIDKSFLLAAPDSRADAAIVRSIIELGHNLGCTVVAEGVETPRAWSLLAALGCDAVQGYHVSGPLPRAGFSDWLDAGAWSPTQ